MGSFNSAKFRTLNDVLLDNKGVGPGFDLVRIGLAALIFYGHCFWVAGPMQTSGSLILPSGSGDHQRWVPLIWEGQTQIRYMLVPMFFVVSGFLVTGSAFRTHSLKAFLMFRVLRIAPALATEVCLSALILGPLLTTSNLADYFSDPQFFDYLGNVVGRVRMLLPGVFLTNPATRSVNVNLWTLPAEFYCYSIVAVSLLFGLLLKREIFTAIFAVITAGFFAINVFDVVVMDHSSNFEPSTVLVVYYFFCGCLLFHWRDRIPFSLTLFVASSVASYFLYVLKMVSVAPLLVAYSIIFIGMVKFPRFNLIQRGDYSYGVYLYGFPIAQSVVYLLPQVHGHGWRVLAIAGPLTFGFAMVSWHFIERPTLSLKKLFAGRPALAEEAEALLEIHSGAKI